MIVGAVWLWGPYPLFGAGAALVIGGMLVDVDKGQRRR